ncbi:hypothetical protein L9F63_003825, partial [Diploptera punctata]
RSPTYQIARWLCSEYKNMGGFENLSIDNSLELIEDFKHRELEPTDRLVSFDVVSLFPKKDRRIHHFDKIVHRTNVLYIQWEILQTKFWTFHGKPTISLSGQFIHGAKLKNTHKDNYIKASGFNHFAHKEAVFNSLTHRLNEYSLYKIIKTNKNEKIGQEYKSGIYQIKCQDCDKIYIGKTKRNLKTRLKEHLRNVKKGEVDKCSSTFIISSLIRKSFFKTGRDFGCRASDDYVIKSTIHDLVRPLVQYKIRNTREGVRFSPKKNYTKLAKICEAIYES